MKKLSIFALFVAFISVGIVRADITETLSGRGATAQLALADLNNNIAKFASDCSDRGGEMKPPALFEGPMCYYDENGAQVWTQTVTCILPVVLPVAPAPSPKMPMPVNPNN